MGGLSCEVALRKESVDRNVKVLTSMYMYGVALRKESVDRNSDKDADWVRVYVALRKESVERNTIAPGASVFRGCRSPQGERG